MAVAATRGYATGTNTGIATVDVAIPADVAVGDWMLVQLITTTSTGTVATPSGWYSFGAGSVIGTRQVHLYAKRRVAGDASTVTFTASVSSAISYSIVYGSGGIVDPASWIVRSYPNDVNNLFVYDKRYTYYLETGGTNGGNQVTTRARGMDVPAKTLVLTAFAEATGATETDAQVTVSGATRWFFSNHIGSNINTHMWATDFATTAKTTADVLGVYPNAQTSNGAGKQVAIPELAEAAPVVNVQATFDSGVSSPFTVFSGGTSRFEKAVSSAHSGTAGQRRVSGTEANHAQSVTPEAYTPTESGYRYTGYVKIDANVSPSLAGIVVGANADGSGGIQALIDTRNGTNTAPGTGSVTSSLQLRIGMASNTLGGFGAAALVRFGIWYRIEVDYFASGFIKMRVYEDSTNNFIGSVEATTTLAALTGGIGYYSYGLASFDDISLVSIPPLTKAPLRIANGDGTTRTIQALYWDGSREVGISRFEMVQRGLTVPEFFSQTRVGKMAHRGSSLDYQEHTARGYLQSAIAGVDVMEMSLQITSDDVIILSHDPTANRTSSSVGPSAAQGGTDWRFDQHTWAEVQALVQDLPGRLDTRFTTDRYYRFDELAPRWVESHIVLADPKNITAAKLPLVIAYIKTLTNYKQRVMGKYFHTGLAVGRAFANEEIKTWGFAYEVDLFQTGTKTPRLDTDTQSLQYNHRRPAENGLPAFEWDMLGLEWSASQEAWTEILRLAGSRKVIGHIVATVAQADAAVSKGAKVLQISGVNAVTTKY